MRTTRGGHGCRWETCLSRTARNNRVLEYSKPILPYNTTANKVFGQGNSFSSSACNIGGHGPSSPTLCGAAMLAIDVKGDVDIGDTGNNRVVEYNVP